MDRVDKIQILVKYKRSFRSMMLEFLEDIKTERWFEEMEDTSYSNDTMVRDILRCGLKGLDTYTYEELIETFFMYIDCLTDAEARQYFLGEEAKMKDMSAFYFLGIMEADKSEFVVGTII